MSARQTATPHEVRWIGAGAALIGLYFLSIGIGLLPVPGGPRNLHGPLWIVLLVGLTFLLAGVAVLIQVIGRANDSGELPAGAPHWIRIVQYLIGVAIFASFALVGSWIALLGDGRQFSSIVLVFSASINEIIARTAFGFGAIICWLGTIAFAVSGARKLRSGSVNKSD
jgi:hypothetical protein